MRKIGLLICAVIVAGAVPTFAETTTPSMQRDECLLASRSCANQVDSIQQKISRLQGEISKGTKVYNPQELRMLKAKLDETNALLENLLRPD